VDFHADYNSTTIPYILRGSTSRKAFFKPAVGLGGAYKFKLKANDLCDDQETTLTVTITCDSTPTVNALDYINSEGDEITATLTVKASYWGLPFVYLFGSVSDAAEDSLLGYSWKVINATIPLQYDYDEQEPLEDLLEEANLALERRYTLRPIFKAPRIGTYTFELSVFDGCQYTTATAQVEVQCTRCNPAPRINPPEKEKITWNKPGAGDGTWENFFVSATDSFDPELLPMEYNWKVVSGKPGTMMEEASDGNYIFYEILVPRTLISTETAQTETLVPPNPQVIINGPPFEQLVPPYQVPELKVVETFVTTENIVTTLVTMVYLDEVRKDHCRIEVDSPNQEETNIQVYEEADLDEELALCPGYYGLMLEGNDECQGNHTQSDTIMIHVDCELPPRAFASCDSQVEFDYSSRTFPSASFDASGSYDPNSYPGDDLSYSWEVTAAPEGSTQTITSTSVTTTFQPDARGTYEVTMTTHNQCKKDSATVYVEAICTEEKPVASIEQVPNQQFDGLSPFQVPLRVNGSHPEDNLSYLWEVISIDPPIPEEYLLLLNEQLEPVFTDATSESPALSLYWRGEYNIRASVSDGCTDPVEQTLTFSLSCDATVTTDIDTSPEDFVEFNYVTNTFNALQLIGSGSSIVGNGYTVQSYETSWYLISSPYSEDYVFLSNGPNDFFTPSLPMRGTYVFRFYQGDGCRHEYRDIAVEYRCIQNPVAIIELDPDTPNPIVLGPPINLLSSASNPDIDSRRWYLIEAPTNPSTLPELLSSSENFGFNPGYGPGTYVILLTVDDGCKTDNATIELEIQCPEVPYEAVAEGTTSTFSKGKFSRVELHGENSNLQGQEPSDFEYLWEVVAAPTGSIYEPRASTNTTVLTTVSNETFPGVNTTAFEEETIVTTTTTEYTRKVYLVKPLSNLERPFAACFFPDLPGTYSLQLHISNITVEDPTFFEECYIKKSELLTVTASCNNPPNIVANDIEVQLASNVQTRVVLDASGTTDPNGDRLTFLWEPIHDANESAPINSLEELTNPKSPRASFIPPHHGSYPFLLTVSDGCTTTTREVTVTAICPYVEERAADEDLQEQRQEMSSIVATFDQVTISHKAFELQDSTLASLCVKEYEWELLEFNQSAAAGELVPITRTGGFIGGMVVLGLVVVGLAAAGGYFAYMFLAGGASPTPNPALEGNKVASLYADQHPEQGVPMEPSDPTAPPPPGDEW